jgi:hypothetical protein
MQTRYEKEDNSEMNLHETAYEDGSWIGLAKDHSQWQNLGSSSRVRSGYNEKTCKLLV